ncbi:MULTISPECIES: NAD-dependent epimerase/dehydratase family protein [unclassified Bacillus (in: firmicutes)]|uniref:NAD-dependent epimerase/dehydratase family protein n=1 Tax=unclassified Bacillus (in: firmicutes) TaxID=185979 RepID=UPI001BE5A111|nr:MULTISPECIES: NAD-dependent epimerase/dehydratase family protein [unclassified Bacillus (in: firmicutes)]MBT2639495.1 NAD-dependent epimerase/dehydratase family protein [Bacillus sp. ISL-39]MBT2662501.1 NAD-dependent epimerase/dehydratase family protein [Bacillus sp. ISL-45]
MRKILVLGGTQYFGKKLVQKLIKNGDEVTIATRGMKNDPFGENVKRLVIDREKKETMAAAFEGKEWDLVYDQSCFSPMEARDTVEALKGKAARYIFTSTQAVYDFGTLHTEGNFNAFTYPIEYKSRKEYPGYEGYKEAKRASEAVFNQLGYFEVVSVRFPIVVSEDDYTERLKFHVDKILSGQPIGMPDPDLRYSFIHADEAADFLLDIGKSNFEGPINPGSSGDISLKELVDKIALLANKEAIVKDTTENGTVSPYALPGSWSIDTALAAGLGFKFTELNQLLDQLFIYYIELNDMH